MTLIVIAISTAIAMPLGSTPRIRNRVLDSVLAPGEILPNMVFTGSQEIALNRHNSWSPKSLDLRIVVAEYPKSGGTWIVSVLGDALGLPKRDIYVSDEYKSFDVRKHPWYKNAPDLVLPDACVIKSHELPNSDLHSFPMRLVRDGRDVVVSRFFYDRDFCVANGIYSKSKKGLTTTFHTWRRTGTVTCWLG